MTRAPDDNDPLYQDGSSIDQAGYRENEHLLADGEPGGGTDHAPRMVDGKHAVTGAIISSISGIMSLVAGFCSSVIVARLLGAEGNGTVALALWFMVLATAIADRGWSNLINRYISGDTESDSSKSRLLSKVTRKFALSTGVMAAAVLAYAATLFVHDDRTLALIWAATALLFLSYAYAILASAAARGLGRFKDAASTTIVGCVLQPVGVLLGALTLGPAGAILGNTLRHLPQALSLRWYLASGNSKLAQISHSMKRYARNNWHGAVLYASAGTRAELAIIGIFFTLADVGYYAIGLTVSGLIIQLSAYVQASLLPHFSALHDQGGLEALRRSFGQSLRWMAMLAAPICFGGAAIAPQLIPLVFGQAFVPAIGLSQVLLIWAFVQTLTFVQSNLMLARHRSGWAVWASAGWNIAALIVMLVLAPSVGLLGLAAIKLIFSVGSLVTSGWFCTARLSMPTGLSDISKIVLAGALSAIAASLCLHWLPDFPAMALMLAIGVGGIVYLAAIMSMALLSPAEWAQMRGWISKPTSIFSSFRGNA